MEGSRCNVGDLSRVCCIDCCIMNCVLGMDIQWRLSKDTAWSPRRCHVSAVWWHAHCQRLNRLYAEVLGPAQSMQCQSDWLEGVWRSHWGRQVITTHTQLTVRWGSGTYTINAMSKWLIGRHLKVTLGSSGNHDINNSNTCTYIH